MTEPRRSLLRGLAGRRLEFAVAAGVFAVDRATKIWADADLVTPVSVVPRLLRFALSHNRGAMFGALDRAPEPWRMIALAVLPALALIGLCLLIARAAPGERRMPLALALVLGGVAGNVLDRALYGHVIDFIDVYAGWPAIGDRLVAWFGTNRWPTFNIADVALVAGIVLLAIDIMAGRTGPAAASDRRAR